MSLALRSVLVALVATAASGALDGASAAAHAAAKGRTTISITRTNDFLYLAAPAAIEINGSKVASLGRAESYKGQIAPGPTAITVSTWSSPGSSSVRFTAMPGKTYRMVVGPRGKNFAANIMGGLIGAAIEGGGAFEIVPAP
jgi:hypothetical protein